MSMLVWLTLPFYDFCGFRSVAVNSVYKLQFFTFIFAVLLPVVFWLLTPKMGSNVKILPKVTSLRESASFEPSCVKIRRRV